MPDSRMLFTSEIIGKDTLPFLPY